MPGTLSILTNTFLDPRERAQAIGIWAGISGMALAAGPVVGGLLVDSFGWQSVFFLNVPIGIVAFVVCWLAVRESKNPQGRRLDLPGQVLAIVGLGSLTYALIEANSYGWGSALILSFSPCRRGVGGLCAGRTAEPRAPCCSSASFATRTFTGGCICASAVSFGMFGMFFFFSLFFQNVQGYSPLQAGLRALPSTAMIIIVAPLAGRMAGRIGSEMPDGPGPGFERGQPVLVHPDPGHQQLLEHLAATAMAGIGMAMVMPPMTAAVMGSVPPARAGMASATSNASREIGGVFGIALLGAIVTHVFTRDVDRIVSQLNLPPSIKATILRQVASGVEQAGGTLPAGSTPGGSLTP